MIVQVLKRDKSLSNIVDTSHDYIKYVASVTPREKEVLQKMSQGLSVKEIASILFVSDHTINSHKKNLILKLNARNSVDLIVKSIRHGLVVI